MRMLNVLRHGVAARSATRVEVREERVTQGSTHNLQLHRLSLELNRPNLEVHPDRAQVTVRERVFRKPQEQT